MKQHRQGSLGCRSGGFTLPELMAVVAILAILGTLASVSMGRRTRHDAVAGLAREVHARLVQARFAAISGGSRVQVRLVPGLGVAPVELRTAVRPGLLPTPTLPNDGFGPLSDQVSGRQQAQLVAVSPTVDPGGPPPPPSAAPTRLIFYPDGHAQLDGAAGPGVTIYLADAGGEYPFRVTVLGRTGFARLVER